MEVAASTGPLEVLAGEKVLAVADAENLDLGARDLGLRICWGALGRKLEEAAGEIRRHVVFPEAEGERIREHFFAERGWVPHVKRPRWVRSCRGWKRISNADSLLVFVTAYLLPRWDTTLILVCSGDGALVEEVAEAAQGCEPGQKIATLSLAGSTSARLNAACSPFVVANLEVGMDCMQRVAEHRTDAATSHIRLDDLACLDCVAEASWAGQREGVRWGACRERPSALSARKR